jgi:hypothetical protein
MMTEIAVMTTATSETTVTIEMTTAMSEASNEPGEDSELEDRGYKDDGSD